VICGDAVDRAVGERLAEGEEIGALAERRVDLARRVVAMSDASVRSR